MPKNTVNVAPSSESDGFDHAITAMTLAVTGSFLTAVGAIMTGLSYAWENRSNFTSVAESYGLRTDVAGPVMLSLGSAEVIMAIVLVSIFHVFAPPDWTNRKSTSTTSASGTNGSSSTVDITAVSYRSDPFLEFSWKCLRTSDK